MQLNEHSERPSGPLKTHLSVTRNASLVWQEPQEYLSIRFLYYITCFSKSSPSSIERKAKFKLPSGSVSNSLFAEIKSNGIGGVALEGSKVWQSSFINVALS